jgi:Tfp pilus assembly protein PilV
MNIKLCDKRAFTLTEILFSIGLLLLVWLAAVNATIIAKFSGSYAKHKIQAVYIAQQTIENLRKTPFASIANSTTTATIDTNGTPYTTTDDFTGTQIVTVTSPSSYYKQIIVEVRWNEILLGKNKTMREYCATIIANEPQVN